MQVKRYRCHRDPMDKSPETAVIEEGVIDESLEVLRPHEINVN